MVRLTFVAQWRSVYEKRLCRFQCPSAEMPKIRRKQPRPPHHVTGPERLNRNRTLVGGKRFQLHCSPLNEIKPVGRFAFAENNRPRLEVYPLRCILQESPLMRFHIPKEGMPFTLGASLRPEH